MFSGSPLKLSGGGQPWNLCEALQLHIFEEIWYFNLQEFIGFYESIIVKMVGAPFGMGEPKE